MFCSVCSKAEERKKAQRHNEMNLRKDASGAIQIQLFSCLCGPASRESHLLICSLPRPPLGFSTDVLAEVSPKVSLAHKARPAAASPTSSPRPALCCARGISCASPSLGGILHLLTHREFLFLFSFFLKKFFHFDSDLSQACVSGLSF